MTERESSALVGPLDILFSGDALVPAVVQDHASGAVLMLGYMNREALDVTRATSRAHFWSRSRAKLWQKGETSGHIQIVESISVNCESNSLLIAVRQMGAVCHEGYGTCFYRRLGEDGQLIVDHPQLFDPHAVYDGASARVTRLWLGAYEYLRDHDLADRSNTSTRLRSVDGSADIRLADELQELAGVLDGSHVHHGLQADALLEGSQCLYWLAVASVGRGLDWSTLRPDIALRSDATDTASDPETLSSRLRGDSNQWRRARSAVDAATIHDAIADVAAALQAVDIEPGAAIIADLVELRSKSYLAPYFESAGVEGDPSLATG